MNTKRLGVLLVMACIAVVLDIAVYNPAAGTPAVDLDPTPKWVTLSGTYVCLPHLDTRGPQTEECAFGIKTDAGDYYAVNFGQSAEAMERFRHGAHITADGFVVIKEALNTDQWEKYDMKGIFTITTVQSAVDTRSSERVQ